MRRTGIAPLPAAIAALGAVGIAVSLYLTTVHYADRPVYCAGISSCETVNSSAYAELAGLPVALLGLATYIAITVLALLSPRLAWAGAALLFVAVTGTLFSAYLTWVELAVLHAVCAWCVVSAILITAITVLALRLFFQGSGDQDRSDALPLPATRPAPRRVRRSV